MSRPVATIPVPVEKIPEALALEEALVRAFNELRDELLSTLWFILGNRDDAQEIAQEVFLRCWRLVEHDMGYQSR